MKKVTSVCLIFFIIFTFFTGTALAAPEYTGTKGPFAILLMDADSQRILYEENIDERMEPASTTKILTCIVALENSDPADLVEVSAKAAGTRGSTLNLVTGEKVAMKDLLNGMMMVSGNDAAVAVAEHLGDTVEGFSEMMNAKAEAIGMKNSHFVTPHGMHAEGHYSTARDMALLTVYALNNPEFTSMVKQASYDMPKDNKRNANNVKNTNKLLLSDSDFYYQYATGIKTGSTPAAHGCLVASASRDGMNLICLVFKDETSAENVRWKVAKECFEWGFDNYRTIDVSTLVREPVKAQVQDYAADDAQDGLLEFKLPEAGAVYVTLPKDAAQGLISGADTLEAVTAYDNEQLTAPVSKGDIFGTVTYKSKATGEDVYSYTLIASRDILAETPGDNLTPVITMAPTPPKEAVKEADNTLFYVALIVAAGGLIVFLIVRMVMARRSRFKKRRRPHYSYRK